MSPFAPPIFKSGRSASHEVATFRRCRRADRSSKPTGGLWAVKHTGCKRPHPEVQAADPGARQRPFVKRDLSRFSASNSPFRERAIGNR